MPVQPTSPSTIFSHMADDSSDYRITLNPQYVRLVEKPDFDYKAESIRGRMTKALGVTASRGHIAAKHRSNEGSEPVECKAIAAVLKTEPAITTFAAAMSDRSTRTSSPQKKVYAHISDYSLADEAQSASPTEVSTMNRITIQHGHVVLHLRTKAERECPSIKDSLLLKTYQRLGSADRARQLEYLLDPIRAQFGFKDTNATEDPEDIAGREKIEYSLSESEANARLKENGYRNEGNRNLEIVERRYAESFEWQWRDFDEHFQEVFEDEPWSE